MWVPKALRNFQEFVSVDEYFNVPAAESSFCHLMNSSFQGKCFDSVIFVDPFLQFALIYLLVKVKEIVFQNVFACLRVYQQK